LRSSWLFQLAAAVALEILSSRWLFQLTILSSSLLFQLTTFFVLLSGAGGRFGPPFGAASRFGRFGRSELPLLASGARNAMKQLPSLSSSLFSSSVLVFVHRAANGIVG